MKARINRRGFIKAAGFGAAVLKMGGSLKARGFGDGRPGHIHPQASFEAATLTSSNKPSIVLIMVDGRSFLPQLRGENGNPMDWIFCHYDPRWGNHKMRRFVLDKRWKLYADGDLYDVPADTFEQSPNPSGPEAVAARKRLEGVLDSIT